MLQFSYLGIAFAIVFYFAFGVAVRLMELSDRARNKARLGILITSLSFTFISSLFAVVLNWQEKKFVLFALFLLLSGLSLFALLAILVELHHINTKVKMRRFMVLFDIVDRFINEGKTHDEIMTYLTEIQKLTRKEASDFLEFISDPQNHQFLADVNEKIHEAQMIKNVTK